MRPKTDLKILFTIFIIAMIGVIVFLNFSIFNENKASLSPKVKKEINQDGIKKEPTKELSQEEIKQMMIKKAETPESIKRMEELNKMTTEEIKELKQMMIDKAK